MFYLSDVRKQAEGLVFSTSFELADKLRDRDSEVIDLTGVKAAGQISFEADLYRLTYDLEYTLTMPSSRSMKPVVLPSRLEVFELFMEASVAEKQQALVDDELVLIVEEDVIDLEESILDNILLNIPLKVLTPEEEQDDYQMANGNHWTLLTQEQYEAKRQEEKEANSPFSALSGLFDTE